MRRLGARLCGSCGAVHNVFEVGDRLVCYPCFQQEQMQEERDHQKRMAEMAGRTAVEMTDRPGDASYRKACEAMQGDLEAIAEDWKFGTGLF